MRVPSDATRANLVLDSNANLLYGDANDEVTVEVTTDTNGRAEEGVVLVTIEGRAPRGGKVGGGVSIVEAIRARHPASQVDREQVERVFRSRLDHHQKVV